MPLDPMSRNLSPLVRSDSSGDPLTWTRGQFFNATTIRWTAAGLAIFGGLIFVVLDFIHHS